MRTQEEKYQGEVCPDCGYPMDYNESHVCGFCGVYHLLPFDSLLCRPNWKPEHPYDAVPFSSRVNAWLETVMLAVGRFLLDIGRTIARLLFRFPPDEDASYGGGQSNMALIRLIQACEQELAARQPRQTSSGYTPLLDDEGGADAPMDTGKVQPVPPDPLSAEALLNRPSRWTTERRK